MGNHAPTLLQLAQGMDDREVEPFREPKSMSSEHTFQKDTEDGMVLLSVLLDEVEKVAERLRRDRVKAGTITLKFRYKNFRTITRSKSLDVASNTTQTLWKASEKIFEQWLRELPGALRLIGFAASGLVSEDTGQQLLFPELPEEKQKRLDQTIDKIRNRYGSDSVRRKY